MRKLLLAATALVALSGAANAAPLISDLGLDPNISVARNGVNGSFNDEYTFTLDQASTLTIVRHHQHLRGWYRRGQVHRQLHRHHLQ